MTQAIQAEHVIKSIIRDISQECAIRGHQVSDTLAAFMVKAVVLDPVNKFNLERALTKSDIRNLIQLCVDRLVLKNSPSLDTIKMQVYFDMNYTTREEFLSEHHKMLKSRMLPVIQEVSNGRARTRDEFEALYKKLVTAIILQSGLGSASDVNTVRETTAALQSVFPQSELGAFIGMSLKDKEREFHELTMIVTGIRLFNKENAKGGQAIDNLPEILNEAIPATKKNIDSGIETLKNLFNEYTALAERPSTLPDNFPLTALKQAVVNCRQCETYLRILVQDIIGCAQQVGSLESQLNNRMTQLKATIQTKAAVPTAHVYPQFMHVAQIWAGLQDEMVMLSVLNNLLFNVTQFTKGHREIFSDDVLRPLLASVNVKTDEERAYAAKHSHHSGDEEPHLENFLYPDTTQNFSKLDLQLKGFCGWSLVKFEGLLIKGNPAEVGVFQYKGNYYAFASRQAAIEFSEDPEKYISLIGEIARKNPEMIQLLELHTQFSSIASLGQRKEGAGSRMIEKPILKCESGTQTDTHFYESNLVRSYEWNEWELRRKAIKLANLRKKVTRSAQTVMSNYRRDNAVQCQPLRDLSTQTVEQSSSTVPRPQTFLAGLRGTGLSLPTVLTKVDLTLDINEN